MTAHDPDAFEPLILDALHVPASQLRMICRQLAPAHERHSKIAVLRTVLVQAGRHGTSFQLTDLDLTIRVQADDLTCQKPWRACVPFALLQRLAATFDGILRLTHVKAPAEDPYLMDRLTITADDGTSATINLICRPDDFPQLPETLDDPPAWHVLPMTQAQLRRYLDLAAHCISREETRYYLNGLWVCRKPGETTLRAVATDGHRMAVIDGGVAAPEGIGTIIPTVAVRTMRSLTDAKANEPAMLLLHKDAHRMRLVFGNLLIDCKTIDGKYPDYTRVIPQNPTRASVTLTAVSLRRLTPFMSDMTSAVCFRAGLATLRNPTLGEVSIAAPMTLAEGADPMEIGFNLRFIDAQARLTPTFRMDFISPSDPCRIHSEDPSALWILMPMRV
ncbi:MAG: hypothetical protein JNK19_03005 [Tabrizicola sp.]|nr:hypothetical protein [Tabrizicola sp.]